MPCKPHPSTTTKPKNVSTPTNNHYPNTTKNHPTYQTPILSQVTELLTSQLTNENAQIPIKYIQNLENQIIHLQRLSSIGQLTSEVIHDFNNILGTIIGYTTLLKNQLEPQTEAYDYAHIIEKSSRRATKLTQQLLNSSRKETNKTNSLNINEIINDVKTILTKTLRKEIRLTTKTQQNIPNIQGDKSQIHQVLINLCINASDAITHSGTITITSKLTKTKKNPQYIQITISDNGIGIEPSIKDKIFEPFFTTKEEGKGTGLGLSVVKTILEKHNGEIKFKTTTDQGTTFKILIPIKRDPDSTNKTH